MGPPQPPQEPRWVREEDYFDAGDVPKAVGDAYTVVNALGRREIDPILRKREIEVALEVVCDGPNGNPALAFRALMNAQPRYRNPERWEREDRISRATRPACGLTLTAEVAHRAERYPQAVVFSLTALGLLEEAAGGRDSLLKLVASSKSHRLAEAATAVGAIYIPALRRAGYPPQAKEDLRKRIAPYLPAYLASGRIDGRSHAFTTQNLFDQVERQREDLLDELRAASDQTRGNSVRAQATAPLVTMEHAKALGDLTAAKREAARAMSGLQAFGLERHIKRVEQFRYLRPQE
jgi:hypothetical protein